MAELLGRGFESLPPDDDFTLLLFFGFVCISPEGPDLPHSTFFHTSSVPLARHSQDETSARVLNALC